MNAKRVALATWSKRWPLPDDEDDLLLAALRDLGVDATRLVWDRDALTHDLCVIRTTWDYFERREEFLKWADTAATRARLWNGPAVLRWNAHKSYLLELAARGVPCPDGELLRGGDANAVIRRRGWSKVILKPAVGVGALDTLVAAADETERIRDHADLLLRRGELIVQEYLASVHDVGELSLVFFDGILSHTVRKVPAAGDYRAHPYWGATVSRVTASARHVASAKAALAAIPGEALYARVDLLERSDGTPALIELELIEPYLFLDEAAARSFAGCIARRL